MKIFIEHSSKKRYNKSNKKVTENEGNSNG